jgi:hypothetical protein
MKSIAFIACLLSVATCGCSPEPPSAADTRTVTIEWVNNPIWGNRQFEVHHHIAAIAGALKTSGKNVISKPEPPFWELRFVLRFALNSGRVVEIPVYAQHGECLIAFKCGETYQTKGGYWLYPVVARLSALIASGTDDVDDRLLKPDTWNARDAPPIESMTLYSLKATMAGEENENGSNKAELETFHRYPVLGKVDVALAADRVAILDAIQKAKNPDPTNVECFDPHHGVRLTRSGTTIDYVICFHCDKYDEYLDGLPVAGQWQIGDRAKSVLDAYLQKARVRNISSRSCAAV